MPCAQLMDDYRCAVFGQPERPAVCRALRPEMNMCGETREHAIEWLDRLEQATRPEG
jgi:hypothetical protein